MVTEVRRRGRFPAMASTVFGLLMLLPVSPSGCKRSQGRSSSEPGEKVERSVLGEVRVGRELAQFYIAQGFDSAILGFSVSSGSGPVQYFPMYASTNRGIPPVILEVFASKSQDEMWVRSSWPDNQILAYRRAGSESAITEWGETKFLKEPMPDHLSGGATPFPALRMGSVVKMATFKHD